VGGGGVQEGRRGGGGGGKVASTTLNHTVSVPVSDLSPAPATRVSQLHPQQDAFGEKLELAVTVSLPVAVYDLLTFNQPTPLTSTPPALAATRVLLTFWVCLQRDSRLGCYCVTACSSLGPVDIQ
jgi:hypothetical protein